MVSGDGRYYSNDAVQVHYSSSKFWLYVVGGIYIYLCVDVPVFTILFEGTHVLRCYLPLDSEP